MLAVVESLHVKPGKGAAFVRTKLKHQISGNSSDKTFRAGETVATADIAKQESQYTYADGNEVCHSKQLNLPKCTQVVSMIGLTKPIALCALFFCHAVLSCTMAALPTFLNCACTMSSALSIRSDMICHGSQVAQKLIFKEDDLSAQQHE